MDTQITKRDGTVESFSIDKLITSIAKAGVPLKESEKMAGEIKEWIVKTASNGEITSNQIRDKIIEVMSVEYPAEVDSYKAYKK